jgi:hypothetical protein
MGHPNFSLDQTNKPVRRGPPVRGLCRPAPFHSKNQSCFELECRGKRPMGIPSTSTARPPRLLVRCRWDLPRPWITCGRRASRGLGRSSAVPRTVSEPFLSRFWVPEGEKSVFEARKPIDMVSCTSRPRVPKPFLKRF